MSTLAHVRLEATCTLREAEDLHFSLLAVDRAANPVRVDAGSVERVDTAGLQILVAFVRDVQASGRAVSWTAASAELRRCAGTLALIEALSLGNVSAGEH